MATKTQPRGALAALEGLGHGFAQGAMLGLGDELLFNMGVTDFGGARSRAPIAYSVGEGLGAVIPGALFGRGATGPLANLLARAGLSGGALNAATGGLIGAAHGGLAGVGGLTPGDMSLEERLESAAALALLGGAVGGLAVPAYKATSELVDNAPAIAGRMRTEDGVVQTRLGQGTRRSAPERARLRGEGDVDARAGAALDRALGMDEFELAQAGKPDLNRYGGPMTPFDQAQGRSTRSLVDYAAQSPAGSRALNDQADGIVRTANQTFVKGAAMPKAGKSRARISDQVMDGMVAAFDRPEYHDAFVREAKKLKPNQRLRVANALMARMREQAQTGDPNAVRAQLQDPKVAERFRALGVKLTNRQRRALMTPAEESRVQTLRDRAAPAENPRFADGRQGFANIEDRMLAARTPLSEQDALALLRASQRPREAFAPQPTNPADTRLLEATWDQGMHFNPRGWFDTTRGQLEGAAFASQPAAAFLHGAGYWDDERPQDAGQPGVLQQLRALLAA